jgi:hypothetical protein
LESGDAIDNACEHCHQKYWYPHPEHFAVKFAEADQYLPADLPTAA